MTRRPWYTRSPWKDALSHSIAVIVAILCTLGIKQCTGVTMPVEAATTPPPPVEGPFTVATVIVSASASAPPVPAAAAPVGPR